MEVLKVGRREMKLEVLMWCDTASEPFMMKKSKGSKFGSFLFLSHLAADDKEDVHIRR